MKRKYIQPETLSLIFYEPIVMDSNSDPNRVVAGDPTNNGLPSTVGETDDDTDPYGGHGQGSGGGGNRGKEFDLWDIESFDVWD